MLRLRRHAPAEPCLITVTVVEDDGTARSAPKAGQIMSADRIKSKDPGAKVHVTALSAVVVRRSDLPPAPQ